ncbi:HAD-IA family hydrolase [Bacillus cereus]
MKPDFTRIQNLFPDLDLKEEKIDKALYPTGCDIGAGLGPGDDNNKFVYQFAIESGIPPEKISGNEKELQNIILFSEWVPRKLHETKKVLQYLRSKNKKIVIVSNTDNGSAAKLLLKLKVCSVNNFEGVEKVDKIIDSWIVGIHKPDHRIYEYSANQINVDISRCLHIGDSIRNDYNSAKKAGAKAILFSPYEKRGMIQLHLFLILFPDNNWCLTKIQFIPESMMHFI